jgi:prephenate dehydrogenase
MKEIGLIGFGKFGKLIHSFLKDHFNISIYDPLVMQDQDYSFTSLAECAGKDIVVLAVPVQNLEETLFKIKTYIKKKALVFDVCSVKVKPVELMKRNLPGDCRIIGTHPLFGPAGVKEGLKSFDVVLCPVRPQKLDSVILFLKDVLGLNIIFKTPEEHDREMAVVQALTHFLAKALNKMDINEHELKTLSFEYLFKVKELLKFDSDALLYTIENENPFAEDVRKKFIEILVGVDNDLKRQLNENSAREDS